MFNLGAGELLVILIVALLVLGPTKLPGAARQMGKAMAELRRMTAGFQKEFQDAVNEPVEGFRDVLDADKESEARRRGREATERMAAQRRGTPPATPPEAPMSAPGPQTPPATPPEAPMSAAGAEPPAAQGREAEAALDREHPGRNGSNSNGSDGTTTS